MGKTENIYENKNPKVSWQRASWLRNKQQINLEGRERLAYNLDAEK